MSQDTFLDCTRAFAKILASATCVCPTEISPCDSGGDGACIGIGVDMRSKSTASCAGGTGGGCNVRTRVRGVGTTADRGGWEGENLSTSWRVERYRDHDNYMIQAAWRPLNRPCAPGQKFRTWKQQCVGGGGDGWRRELTSPFFACCFIESVTLASSRSIFLICLSRSRTSFLSCFSHSRA